MSHLSERSMGSLVLAVVAVGLIGASLALPWFSYDHSSGRRTPEGGFHPANETGVIRTSFDTTARSYEGDFAPDSTAQTKSTLNGLSIALFAAGGLLVLAALGELPGIERLLVRPVVLGLHVAAFAAVGVALWLGWFAVPELLASRGVDSPFTSFLDSDGYTQTTLRIGWVLAAFALPAVFGAFLFKFQAGAPDATAVADLAERGEL